MTQAVLALLAFAQPPTPRAESFASFALVASQQELLPSKNVSKVQNE